MIFVMSMIKEFLYKSTDKICSVFHIIKVYETNKGLKNINMCAVSNIGELDFFDYIELEPNQLFLGPDFLNDKFSLLDLPISQSPHFAFMDALINNKNLLDTEYIKRFQKGTLDWRRPTRVENTIYWTNRFNDIYPTIIENTYPPVVVYKNNGKFYIYDGKHRAALCAYLGRKIRCVLIPKNYITGFYGNYFFNIIKTKNNYERHKIFWNNSIR